MTRRIKSKSESYSRTLDWGVQLRGHLGGSGEAQNIFQSFVLILKLNLGFKLSSKVKSTLVLRSGKKDQGSHISR